MLLCGLIIRDLSFNLFIDLVFAGQPSLALGILIVRAVRD